MKIENKVAIVTGASGGIGLATAIKLLDNGAKALAMVDISERIGKTAQDLINYSENPNIRGFCGDVSDCDFRNRVFSNMLDEFGPVQICVPAAGIVKDGLAVKQNHKTGEVELYSEDKFRQILDVNLLTRILGYGYYCRNRPSQAD